MTSHSVSRLAARGLASWLVLILAEILHGVLRAVILVPWVGEFRSDQIGVFTGSLIVVAVAWWMVGWIGATKTDELLLVGILWLVSTVAFEVLLGRIVLGMTWKELAAGYDLTRGGWMPLGLAVLVLAPLIGSKLQRTRA